MPTSDAPDPRPTPQHAHRPIRRGAITGLLTLLVSLLLLLANLWGRLTIRDGRGVERVVGLRAIWRTIFARLPRDLPGMVGQGPLLLGLALATVACAYMVVAAFRLPE